MKYLKLFLLAMLVLLASCDDNVYEKFDTDFSDNRWPKTEAKTYDFNIESSGKFDFLIDFSHVYGSPFASVPLKLAMRYPNHEIVTYDISLLLVDDEGNSMSDCTGDICDFEQAVFANKDLKSGGYEISISNAFSHEFLPNVLGIGIRVVASK